MAAVMILLVSNDEFVLLIHINYLENTLVLRNIRSRSFQSFIQFLMMSDWSNLRNRVDGVNLSLIRDELL